jgi:RNA polymerase sigma-70 factor (ECF subfamily)
VKSDALAEQLTAWGVSSSKAQGECQAFIAKRSKPGVELCEADLILVWAVLRGAAGAMAEIDALIVGLARRAAGTSIEPAELAQRVRTRLLVGEKGKDPKLATYDGRGRLKSWLWTATKLELLQATRGMGQGPADDVDELTHLASPQRSPELSVRSFKDTKLVSKALREALEVLDAKERTMLRMRFVDGVSTEELGKLFQVHRTTAQRWIEAAQAKIMAAMRARLQAEAKLARGDVDSLVGEVAQSISLHLSQVLTKDGLIAR